MRDTRNITRGEGVSEANLRSSPNGHVRGRLTDRPNDTAAESVLIRTNERHLKIASLRRNKSKTYSMQHNGAFNHEPFVVVVGKDIGALYLVVSNA